MPPKRREKTPGDPASVGPSVQREVHPGIGVPFTARRRKIGWVRQNQVEPSQTNGQIGSYDIQHPALDPGPPVERAQRGRIQIRGHHETGPVLCRGEGRHASATSDLEYALAGARPCEAGEETRVLPNRIHLEDITRTCSGHLDGSRSPARPEYPIAFARLSQT
jgi:hypothetical protein